MEYRRTGGPVRDWTQCLRLSHVEMATLSAARLFGPLLDPNIGQNDDGQQQPFHSYILSLIYSTGKLLIDQWREVVLIIMNK